MIILFLHRGIWNSISVSISSKTDFPFHKQGKTKKSHYSRRSFAMTKDERWKRKVSVKANKFCFIPFRNEIRHNSQSSRVEKQIKNFIMKNNFEFFFSLGFCRCCYVMPLSWWEFKTSSSSISAHIFCRIFNQTRKFSLAIHAFSELFPSPHSVAFSSTFSVLLLINRKNSLGKAQIRMCKD